MEREISAEHPIRRYFADALHESLSQLGMKDEVEVESYLGAMLVRFLNQDGIYAIRDMHGRRVDEVAEMLVQGDVRLSADSFDREREVHRHVGDFLLFWSGLFPEFLKQLRDPLKKDALLDPVSQGRLSYFVVSTFDYGRYADEAPVFRRLSSRFEAYQAGLSLVRDRLPGLEA